MKTIGLIGGMSWESTVTYYQVINETVRNRLGGLHSAKIFMESVDFADIAVHQFADDWTMCAELVGDAAVRLEKAGADFIVIGTNTMHKVASAIEARLSVPLIGTKTTMAEPFYKMRLEERGFEVVVPDEVGMDTVNRIIFEELCQGVFRDDSRKACRAVIADLVQQGAQGLILGCTEIGLLIKSEDAAVPLFDTTLIHAKGAALAAMD